MINRSSSRNWWNPFPTGNKGLRQWCHFGEAIYINHEKVPMVKLQGSFLSKIWGYSPPPMQNGVMQNFLFSLWYHFFGKTSFCHLMMRISEFWSPNEIFIISITVLECWQRFGFRRLFDLQSSEVIPAPEHCLDIGSAIFKYIKEETHPNYVQSLKPTRRWLKFRLID